MCIRGKKIKLQRTSDLILVLVDQPVWNTPDTYILVGETYPPLLTSRLKREQNEGFSKVPMWDYDHGLPSFTLLLFFFPVKKKRSEREIGRGCEK